MPNIIRVIEKRDGKWVCLDDEGDVVLLDEHPHVHTSSPSQTTAEEGQVMPAPPSKKKASGKGR